MKIVTTTNLLQKYNMSENDAITMLQALSLDVEILPTADCHAIKTYTDTVPGSVLLFGGHDVVPFFVMANPCEDPDSAIMSDAPYCCTQDPLYYMPNKVVGRLPDESVNASKNFLTSMVASQVMHMTSAPTSTGWFNMVASVWTGISSFMLEHFNMGDQNIVPPVQYANLQSGQIAGRKFHYLNLHGSQQTPFFYGQSGSGYPIAMQPNPTYFKDSIVFAEACYGGYLTGRNRDTSIPLMAMCNGTVAFIGGSGVQYGPAAPPPDGIDMLALCFYDALLQGKTIGEAFMQAKIDFSTRVLQQSGNLMPSDKKTLLQTYLFGTPDIKV